MNWKIDEQRISFLICFFLGKLTQYNADEIMEFAKYLQNVYKKELEDNFPNNWYSSSGPPSKQK